MERTFHSLAVAFGETLVPLDRSATREERERVWTARMRHFNARIQAQRVRHWHAIPGGRGSCGSF